MFIDGTYRILYIDSGSGFYPVGCLTDHSFSENSETISTTTRDNEGWATSLPTTQSYSISFSGLILYDELDATKQTYYDLKGIKRNRTLVSWKIDETEYGSGYIIDLSNENAIDENVTFSAELVGYGIPIIQLDYVYSTYVARAVAGGGVATNDVCLKNYINSILKN